MPAEALVSRLELAAQPNVVHSARHHARDVLSAWRVSGDAIDSAALAVSELVTNAVQHATTAASLDPLALTLRHSRGQLLVEVSDPDTRPPVCSGAVSFISEGGRGLQMVESVSEEWGYYHPPTGGKVVWCALALDEVCVLDTHTLPKAVAYLRVGSEDTDGLTAMHEKLFSRYAEQHGFDLCHIEYEPGSTVNVSRIGEVIEQHNAMHFLVLSMENVTTHPIIAHALEQAITFGPGTEIHEVEAGA